jgi:hypothetical protein
VRQPASQHVEHLRRRAAERLGPGVERAFDQRQPFDQRGERVVGRRDRAPAPPCGLVRGAAAVRPRRSKPRSMR